MDNLILILLVVGGLCSLGSAALKSISDRRKAEAKSVAEKAFRDAEEGHRSAVEQHRQKDTQLAEVRHQETLQLIAARAQVDVLMKQIQAMPNIDSNSKKQLEDGGKAIAGLDDRIQNALRGIPKAMEAEIKRQGEILRQDAEDRVRAPQLAESTLIDASQVFAVIKAAMASAAKGGLAQISSSEEMPIDILPLMQFSNDAKYIGLPWPKDGERFFQTVLKYNFKSGKIWEVRLSRGYLQSDPVSGNRKTLFPTFGIRELAQKPDMQVVSRDLISLKLDGDRRISFNPFYGNSPRPEAVMNLCEKYMKPVPEISLEEFISSVVVEFLADLKFRETFQK